MKKLIQINTVCNTSTGKIMADIQRQANAEGYDTISFVGRRKVRKDLRCEKFGNALSFWIHVGITTVFDRQGYGSWIETKKLVKRLREEQPDIIHLHNLHGYYLNLPVLFDYLINEFQGNIYWTFHDCWPFTGHCAYFTAACCQRWQKECHDCPNKKEYPVSWGIDASRKNFVSKKEMFTALKRVTVITPSEWMASWVKKSFFKDYDVQVINNGIDLTQFKYKIDRNIYGKYRIPDEKKILLGVASVWSKRKGLEEFINLSEILPNEYQILLVGLNRNQIKKLPMNIVGVGRVDSIEELASFYSIAHIFVNPSTEESFSLVTVEAMACGTPVIVLNTSAVKELVNSENGIVLEKHHAQDYLRAIKQLEMLTLPRESIRRTVLKYDAIESAKKVTQLYRENDRE